MAGASRQKVVREENISKGELTSRYYLYRASEPEEKRFFAALKAGISVRVSACGEVTILVV
jgi:hypothetical protein